MDWTPIIEASTAGVVGLAVIVMAVSILRLARHNRGLGIEVRRLVNNNVALQEAAGLQAEEARRDSALATQPLLVLLDEPPPGIRDQPWAAVKVRNVGNGSALYFVVWMLAAGTLYHSAGAEARGFAGAVHLASGDVFEPGPFQNMLPVGNVHGYLDPGSAVVSDDPATNLMAYCGDTSGNRYRFNLRTADPPDIWERGADAPTWAGAWDPRLSSHPSPAGDALASLPERDQTRLIDALQDALHALQRAAGDDDDVRVTGRAMRRPYVADHRSDVSS
ncbi:MAG: hypothetical protein WB807_00975 [Candidatus Dormiibacterota bacterium]